MTHLFERPVDPDLHEMICAWLQRGEYAKTLLEHFTRHMQRLLKNKPPSFYQAQDPSWESISSMAGEVFRRCAQKMYLRYPYHGRIPFRAFCQDAMSAAKIRGFVFYFRLSIAKEVILIERRHNSRRDPVLAFRDGLYHEVLPVLQRTAQPQKVGRTTRWSVPPDPLVVLRTVEEVAALLHRRGAEPLDALVPEALRLFGHPVSQGQVATVMQMIVPLPEHLLPPEDERVEQAPFDMAEVLTLRKRLLPAWRALLPDDQALACLVLRGASGKEIMEKLPALRSDPAVCNAIKRVAETLLREVMAALDEQGMDPDDVRALAELGEDARRDDRKRVTLPPREKMTRAVLVLRAAVPEVEVVCAT